MTSIDQQMTEIYVLLDDFLKQHPGLAHWRASNNALPDFTDAEVLTVALLQGCFGGQGLKDAWRLVAANYRAAFPNLPGYKRFMARPHTLGQALGDLLAASAALPESADRFYLLDAKPVPLCQPIRHARVRLLREDGAYCGKSSKGWFFGFQLHALLHRSGRVVNAMLLPANWDEHDVTLTLATATPGGVALGDRGEEKRDLLLEEAGLLVLTRADAPEKQRLLSQVRQAIERCFSQLWYKFIDRVFSRSWVGLGNTLRRKLLFYNLCQAGAISR